MNLALNARDAMPAGGLLTIRTSNEPGSVTASGEERASGDGLVVLEVTDSGFGMDEATAARIFESLSSPPREKAREPDWGWQPFMAS